MHFCSCMLWCDVAHTTCYALIIKGFEQDETWKHNECNTNIIGYENGAKCGRPKLETDQIPHRGSSNESNIIIWLIEWKKYKNWDGLSCFKRLRTLLQFISLLYPNKNS